MATKRELTRDNLSTHELILYIDWITHGWPPVHLRDADALITELAWAKAQLKLKKAEEELEEEGQALFDWFARQTEELINDRIGDEDDDDTV